MNTGIGCLFLVQPLLALGSSYQAPQPGKAEPADVFFISGGAEVLSVILLRKGLQLVGRF